MPYRTRSVTLALLLTAAVLVLGGCGGTSTATDDASAPATTATTAASSVVLLEPVRAHGLVAAGPVRVLDVRTPEEYAEGHIEDAELIDFYASDFERRIDALDRSATYVVYCRSGNRSGQATALMAALGFAAVNDVAGGIVAWEAAGLPVVDSPPSP